MVCSWDIQGPNCGPWLQPVQSREGTGRGSDEPSALEGSLAVGGGHSGWGLPVVVPGHRSQVVGTLVLPQELVWKWSPGGSSREWVWWAARGCAPSACGLVGTVAPTPLGPRCTKGWCQASKPACAGARGQLLAPPRSRTGPRGVFIQVICFKTSRVILRPSRGGRCEGQRHPDSAAGVHG